MEVTYTLTVCMDDSSTEDPGAAGEDTKYS